MGAGRPSSPKTAAVGECLPFCVKKVTPTAWILNPPPIERAPYLTRSLPQMWDSTNPKVGFSSEKKTQASCASPGAPDSAPDQTALRVRYA